jgi:hypothetical protein
MARDDRRVGSDERKKEGDTERIGNQNYEELKSCRMIYSFSVTSVF